MTEFRLKNRILSLAAILITFVMCFTVMYTLASADENDGASAESSESSSAETDETGTQTETDSETETSSETVTSTSKGSTQRTTWTNRYRTTTGKGGESSQSSEPDDTDDTATSGSDISSTRKSSLTGVPHEYNRTTYRGSAETVASGTYTTVNTGLPTITQETYGDSGNMSDFSGFSFDFTTIEVTESTSGEETEAEESNPVYRRLAVAFAAAAIVLALGGAGFAVWYKKEEKLKEDQKDLYKF